MTSREIHWNVEGKDVRVRIEQMKDTGTFRMDDRSISFRLLDRNTLEIGGRHVRFYATHQGNDHAVWIDGRIYRLRRTSKSSPAEGPAGPPGGEITATMPGKLLRLEVEVGETVSDKQTVAIMESMKMESALRAPRAGRVTEIRRQPGDAVEIGEVIVVIEE